MPRGLRQGAAGAFYHVMSRGNEKQNIYRCSNDKEKFLGYLRSASKNYNAVIHCYCLMENHFHLLLETPDANISQIMHHINSSYSKYFNAKWERVGHLFQDRFKSILIQKDSYLLELSRYIHLNPVKAGLLEKPELYRWSSYKSYINEHKENVWLERKYILEVISQSNEQAFTNYRIFVEDKIGKEYIVDVFEES